jgi:hypothetical protein
VDGIPGLARGGDAVNPSRLDVVYDKSSRVVGRRIGDEYVLVPLAGRGADLDSILNLNRVGAFIWEQLDGVRTGDEVVAALVARFDVGRPQAEADYLEFLTTLRGLKAVVSVEGGDG